MYFKYQKEFVELLEELINKTGIDNECDTPDYILANYLLQNLITYKKTKEKTEQHIDQEEIPYLEVTSEEYYNLCNTGQIEDNVIYVIIDEHK